MYLINKLLAWTLPLVPKFIIGIFSKKYIAGSTIEDAIEKLNYDLFYIKNMSIFMDLMIVLRTIKIVLFQKGAR